MAVALRLIADPGDPVPAAQAQILTRLAAVSELLSDQYAPNAPAAIREEAQVRIAAYLYDRPADLPSAGTMLHSGAQSILAGYRAIRASADLSADPDDPAAETGGVDEAAVRALVANWAETGNTESIPANKLGNAGGGDVADWAETGNNDLIPANKYRAPVAKERGGPFGVANADVDGTFGGRATVFLAWTRTHIVRLINLVVPLWARDAVTAIPADKLTNAPGSGDDVVNVVDGHLPGAAVAMRLGWSQSRAFVAGSFTRANDHPIDGANLGTTAGLLVPPFPPSLNTDQTLYLGVWIAGDPTLLAIDRTAYLDGEDSFETFPAADREALAVDGDAGFYYPGVSREFEPSEDDTLSITLGGGPLILTSGDVAAWAETGNADLIPAAKLPASSGGGGTVSTLIENSAAQAVAPNNEYAEVSGPASYDLDVTLDEPVNLGLVAEGYRGAAGSSVTLGLSLAAADLESNTAAAEILANSTVSWSVQGAVYERNASVFVLWPHTTGTVTLHLVRRKRIHNDAGNGSIRSIKLLRLP